MIDLNKIAEEIREIISEYQKKHGLTFEEDTHTYTMMNEDGVPKSDWPSVSKVIKLFYEEFDSEGISFKKAKGDLVEQRRLLDEWEAAGTYSTNMGSRVHYVLETKTVEKFGLNKEVRKPIFDCDFEQIITSDSMINAGCKYLDLMAERNAVLLDTEIVLGSSELGYTGQPDKVWVFKNNLNEIGLVITDWKSNKPKNFETNFFTKKMYRPFDYLPNNALGHYNIQIPFYGKLLLKMLEGSKYENIKLFGGIIVLLKNDSTFEEFRISNKTINDILSLDIKGKLKK